MAASSKMIAGSFLLMIVFLEAAMANVYTVYWAADTHYDEWASKYTFLPGDKLRFQYDFEADDIDVEQATEKSFRQCISDPINNTPIERGRMALLEHSGMYYFINGYPNKCTNGWKLQVNVTSAATPSGGAPSPLSLSTLFLLLWISIFSLYLT